MKTSIHRHLKRFSIPGLACLAIWQIGAPSARAGLNLEMNVIRYHQYGYYFAPQLNTNGSAPAVPFGDYYVTSFGYPTNGTSALYHFDTNGFNQVGGGPYGYGDFDSMKHELTNGLWSIFVTNTVTTNVYYFAVTASLTSNDLPYVDITFPADGSLNVTNQPTFMWQGPTNYSDLVVYAYNASPYLPVTQTSWQSPNVLYQGINSFTPHYDSNSTTAVVSSLPTNSAAQPLSSWVSTDHLQDYATSTFTVGVADPSGTSHILVAHYTWDNTNNDGTASGTDTSGNGYDLNFGGGYGAQGGVTSTTDAEASPRAIQFHDGDGNSAGFVGWNPTPSGLLTALSGNFSVSCWIKTTQSGAGGWDQAPAYYGAGIVSADNSGLANDVIPMALTGSKIGFNTGGSVEDVTLNSSASVNDGNYHHVVVTRNQQTGQKIIYIDGVLDSFSSGTTNRLNDPKLITIGALSDASQSDASAANYDNGYDGKVDDLQIYSGVLSAGDVANLYANPGTTIPNGGGSGGGLVVHYDFDEGTVLAPDVSGNNNNMVHAGNFGGSGPSISSDTVAGPGSVSFDGGSYLTAAPALLATLAGEFSVSLWLKTSQSFGNPGDLAWQGAGVIAADSPNAGDKDLIPVALTGGQVAFNVGNGISDNTLNSSGTVNDGSWHHVVVTRSQSTGARQIFIDGTLDRSDVASTVLLDSPVLLTIGAKSDASNPDPANPDYNGSNGYQGLLDDVQIYNRVLSSGEVTLLYNNPGTVIAGSDFATALNTTNLTWRTGGNLPWFTETATTLDGLAAQSGPITDSQSSYLETTVPSDGQLSFNWKVSSEDGYDFLTFYINGNKENAISGEVDWNVETYSLSVGDVLRWEYSKDGSGSAGQDAGFLDEVSYAVTAPNTNSAPIITLNPFSQTNFPGYQVALFAAATSNPTATWQWFKVGAGLIPNATNALYIPANSGTVGAAGSYYAVASNFVGTASSAVADVTFQDAPLPPDWATAIKSQLFNNASDYTTNYNIACLLDSTGNLYTVGAIIGTNFFGPDTLVSGGGASESSFLKQTATGTPIWGRSITNNGNGSSYAECMAAAPNDGIYAAGVFSGTNWLGTNLLVDTAGASTYLARFDAGGNLLWVQTMTGTNGNFIEYHDLTSDSDGNVTISVLLSGETSLGSTNVFATGQQGALVQYDASGNVRWLEFPSSWPSYLTYHGGSIYGAMGGAPSVYIGGVTNTSVLQQALFSINATNGQGNWVRGIAARQGQGNPYGFLDDSPMVAVSGTNLFVAGNAWGSNATFGPFTVTFASSKGQYLARYDTNGNAQLATTFGSEDTWPWSILADASGNVYIGADFDTYSFFGNDVIAAPFYQTVQSLGSDAPGARIPGQTCVAKFDRDGNPLWARPAQSQSSYLNSRDIALATDGVWSCGFFTPVASFGTNTIYGGLTCIGSPICTIQYTPAGYLAKIAEAIAASPVTLLPPQLNGTNFLFQFVSEAEHTNIIQSRTNLVLGSWQTYSNFVGDGTLKTIVLPARVPASRFFRVLTQ